MSALLRAITRKYPEAATVLKEAGLNSDADIRSVTQSELVELFPGHSKFKLRRAIFEIIHQQRPVEELLSELKSFIPHESVKSALTSNRVLVEYLHILKDMKTQVNNVHHFLDAHIGLLENFSKDQPDQKSDKGSLLDTSNADICDPNTCDQSDGHPQGAQASVPDRGIADTYTGLTSSRPQRAQVKYQMVVSGKTHDAHKQFMSKVMDVVRHRSTDQVEIIESQKDYTTTIVFCPIVSRSGSDVNAAMSCVTDGEPVILVSMHHERQARFKASSRTSSNHPNVVLYVNIFFHDTQPGLLMCSENSAAAITVGNKLLEYSKCAGRDRGSQPDRSGSGRSWRFW